MKKFLLETIVFICGAAVMIYELVGSRVLAPYVGTSIFVWSSLIGVIMGSLALGYWLGGKVADRQPDAGKLAMIILIAAIVIGLTAVIKDTFLAWLTASNSSIQFNSIISSLVLFTVPSVLLGAVSPYAAKLRMTSLGTSGQTVGNLYAISTLGSIVGTFLTGFVLIPAFGNTRLFYGLAALLVIASLILFIGKQKILKGAILAFGIGLMITAPAYTNIHHPIDLDTQYNRVWIYDTIDKERTQLPIKVMQTNNESSSAMFLDSDELVFEYTKYYRLADHFAPGLTSALMLGGAAYSYPKDFLAKHPNATIDVVEIDPKLTELADTYFKLPDDSRLTTYHEDGRTYLNRTAKKYDAFLGDAFRSLYSIPYQLTTIESVKKIYSILNPNGVAIINVASAITGTRGEFLRAEYHTFSDIFPQVYVLAVRDPLTPDTPQNLILIALKSTEQPTWTSNNAELNDYLSRLYPNPVPLDMPILTDNHAPVEYLINKII
ncbi:MAG: fused MFS/spermidine synthase [Patescibacteria group bacterium]